MSGRVEGDGRGLTPTVECLFDRSVDALTECTRARLSLLCLERPPPPGFSEDEHAAAKMHDRYLLKRDGLKASGLNFSIKDFMNDSELLAFFKQKRERLMKTSSIKTTTGTLSMPKRKKRRKQATQGGGGGGGGGGGEEEEEEEAGEDRREADRKSQGKKQEWSTASEARAGWRRSNLAKRVCLFQLFFPVLFCFLSPLFPPPACPCIGQRTRARNTEASFALAMPRLTNHGKRSLSCSSFSKPSKQVVCVRACVPLVCFSCSSLSLSCLFLLLPRSWLGSALSRTLALLLAVAIHHPHPLATPPLMPIRNPGHFETEEQAARAIDRKMLQTIGHHAHLLNFPLGTYPDLKHLVQNKDASNDAAPDGGGHTEPATLLPPGSASKRSRGSGSKRANIMPKPRAANEDALDDSGWDLEPADKPKGMRRAGRRGRVEAGLDIWGRRRLST